MKNVTLLILEKGKCYGERLAAFLGRQAYSPFNIQLYLEHPISDAKWKKADLVLITSSLMALYGEKVKEGNVCILDESGQIIGMEGRNVYKYQSAGVIYQRLLEFCEENGWMLQGENLEMISLNKNRHEKDKFKTNTGFYRLVPGKILARGYE